MTFSVLFIAPEDSFRQQLSVLLAAQGHDVREESDPEEGIRVLADQGAEVVLYVSARSSDEDLRHLARLRDIAPGAGIILLEHDGSVDFAIQARRRGVTDDLLIPFELSELLDRIDSAGRHSRAMAERSRAKMDETENGSPKSLEEDGQ